MKVKVPATTANIGSGFDVLGIALNLYNTFELTEKDVTYTLADKAFDYYYQTVQREKPDVKVNICETNIPMSRGLGSSSSLIVGGLLLANRLEGNLLTTVELVQLATAIEGHPDNVAPALLGGLVISMMKDNKVYYQRIELEETIDFVAFIPSYESLTSEARGILPRIVQLDDATFNIAHTALLVTALINKDYQHLDIYLDDRLHEPYRKQQIAIYDEIKSLSRHRDVLGSFISGAGPTMMSIMKESSRVLDTLQLSNASLTIKTLKVNNRGYEWLN